MYISSQQRMLDQYLKEISRIPLLTPEEEVELARRAREGDEKALHDLTRANLRFVVSVAKKYQGRGLSLTDLINEGNYGLIKAAQQFDETRGFKFISYAVWWIRQFILRALAEQSRVVRLPAGRIGTITKIRKMSEKLLQQLGRQPTTEELAEALGLSPNQVHDALQHRQPAVSMDAPLGGEEEYNLLDQLPNEETDVPGDVLAEENLKQQVERALDQLTRREADVMRLYFGIGYDEALTLEEIAQHFDLSYERVRQIRERALLKLRWHHYDEELRRHLP